VALDIRKASVVFPGGKNGGPVEARREVDHLAVVLVAIDRHQDARLDLPESVEQLDVSSWGQLFLKYVVSHPAVTAAIPGMTKVAHLEENLAALRGRMPDAAMRARIEKYWDQNFDG